MTTIIGIVDKGVVYMGADGKATFGWIGKSASLPKIIKKDNMLIGVSGSPRALQLIEHMAEHPAHDTEKESNMAYLVKHVLPVWHEVLKDSEFLQTKEGQENTNSHILIGYRGELFMVDGVFSLFMSETGYDAIGSGSEVALGALYVMHNSYLYDDVTVRSKIHKALDAASYYDIGTDETINIVEITND